MINTLNGINNIKYLVPTMVLNRQARDITININISLLL